MNSFVRPFVCMAIAVLTVLSASCLNADIMGFQSDYAPANWTSVPGTGSIDDFSDIPDSVSLTSGDIFGMLPPAVPVASDTDFTIALLVAGTVSFSWDYASSNSESTFDPFGYLLNGVFVQLTVDGSGAPFLMQSGSVILPGLMVGDVFGWRQSTDDNALGSATTKITLFSGPGPAGPTVVPEPATASLLGIAVLTGAFWQFLKRRRPAATA